MTESTGPLDAPGEVFGSIEAGSWMLDPANSSIRLQQKTMWGLVNVRGVFAKIAGSGEVRPGGSVLGRIELSADSLDTKNKKRDAHLASSDFFDAVAHPVLAFTVDRVGLSSDRKIIVTGNLEVAGKSRQLEFPVIVSESTPKAVTVEADVAVDRSDFGLTWNRGGMIKGPANVSVTARFERQG